MKKNYLPLTILLILTLCLSACGGPATPVSTSEEVSTYSIPSVISTNVQEEVSKTPEASVIDSSSEATAPAYEISYPLCEELETLSLYCTACNFMGPLSSVSMAWEDFECFHALEKLTNVHIDFEAVSFESYMSNYNIYIAAGDYADLIINVESAYVGGTTAAHEDGVIADLTPYLEEYAPDYYAMLLGDPALKEAAYNQEGKILKFITTYDTPGVKNGSLIRGDWAEAMDIEVTDLNSLHEYLLKAKSQFGAEVPVYMSSSANDFGSAFGVHKYNVGGGDMSYYVVDGEVKTPLNQDSYREYLKEMAQWYAEGLIYKDFATASFDPHNNVLNQMIYNGDVAVWATMLEGLDDYEKNATDQNFVSLPIPEITTDGIVNHCTEVEYVIRDSDICITTNCENVPLAVSWMNYWYTEEGIRTYNYGVEGDAYHLDGDTVVLEDFVLNNAYGVDVSSFLRMYCPYGSFAGVYLRSRLVDYSSDLQKEAQRVWTESNDGAYILPDGVTVDAASNETHSALASDIMTYADSMILTFIMGDLDIDTEWDSFIADLEQMGLSQCIAIEQDAYDHYIATKKS